MRPNWGYFLKLFFGLFVATGISFLAFFIRPTDLDPRFGLGVGAIFASVASEYVVTSSLPDTTVLTMADVLHFGVRVHLSDAGRIDDFIASLYPSGRWPTEIRAA